MISRLVRALGGTPPVDDRAFTMTTTLGNGWYSASFSYVLSLTHVGDKAIVTLEPAIGGLKYSLVPKSEGRKEWARFLNCIVQLVPPISVYSWPYDDPFPTRIEPWPVIKTWSLVNG